ncbi:carboxypeptidase N subunit 2-like [Liolophura sinensis]|uniref:carboxypeptidase N subunit 2-like n=1 Tax=Liolophura sinensis TaxID=3198878 RepID=UPI0031589C03
MQKTRNLYHVTFTRKLVLALVLTFSTCDTSDAYCPVGCKCLREKLDCANLSFTTFPSNITDPENFTTIILSGNNLTEVLTENFQFFKNVETLDLSNNAIGSVQDGSFRSLVNLRLLDLSNNRLTSLPEKSFAGLANLTGINLNHNALTELKKSINSAPALKRLQLAHNVIGDVTEDVFDESNVIEEIDLSENSLNDIPSKALVKLPNLRTLVLSSNNLKVIEDCQIGLLRALKNLKLRHNHIEWIGNHAFSTQCVNNGGKLLFNSSTVGHSSLLQALDLSYNRLANISSKYLSPLEMLETLNLNANKFTTIKKGTFQNLSSIVSISLSFMPELKTLENGSFDTLPSLDSLYIHDCPSLAVLEPSVFNSIPNLKVLKISRNGMRTISRDLITWNKDLYIDATGNPFSCDCNLQWIPEVLEDQATNNMTRQNLEKLTCTSPKHFEGKLIVAIETNYLRCSPERKTNHARLKTAAIAASVVIVIGILILVFVKFRNRICIFVKRQFRYKAHRDNRELFSVKLSEIIGENDADPYYEDPNMDLRLRSLVDTEVK